MDKFEKILIALGGLALMFLFGFPQIIEMFFVIIAVIIFLWIFIFDKKKH